MLEPSAESPVGVHRVLAPQGVLPQAAERLDTSPQLWPGETRLSLTRLNLDAASYRQLYEAEGGDGRRVRAAVLDIVARRGKLHNPVTGSGGMLIGTVAEVGPRSPLGLTVGQSVATLVSLTLTPLAISDALADWDGRSEQAQARGHAILFARSVVADVPQDLPLPLALAVFDVCGAPALTARLVAERGVSSMAVLGAAGKSGALALAAAEGAGVARRVAIVRNQAEADLLAASGLASGVAVADARDPLAVAEAVGEPVELTVVCVDVSGAEHGAVLATAAGGTVLFFSMATSFQAAALGAEGLAADVRLVIGNGYLPGHAQFALALVRTRPSLRALLDARIAEAVRR
ncbi:MAG: L-erythro-3,5-diaminohexanoate dehydrogenase [Mycobacteriales bacterium]